MTEEHWELLGRADILFGILGGIGMIWTGGVYLYKRFAPSSFRGRMPVLNIIFHTKLIQFFLLEEAIERASKPIRYCLLIALVFAVVTLVSSPFGFLGSITIIIDTFAAIFISLAIGSIIDSILERKNDSSSVIPGAVIGSFTLMFISLLGAIRMGFAEDITSTTLVSSGLGAIIGAFFAPIFKQVASTFMEGINNSHADPDKLVIKDVRKPVERVTHEGLEVTIEIEVLNTGRARTIHPYVEFKVAEFANGKFKEKIVKSAPNWIIHLPANIETVIPLRWKLGSTTKLLLDPPNKITVRLQKRPISK